MTTTTNEIRVLTLRFENSEVTARFVRLAKRHGYNPSISNDGRWIKCETILQNKSERSKLLRQWANESIEVL